MDAWNGCMDAWREGGTDGIEWMHGGWMDGWI